MNIPDKFETLIITLSDRAYNGEYQDLSGPRIKERLTEYFASMNWKSDITMKLIPDDSVMLGNQIKIATESCNFIFTTGGTGIGPRDITIETISPLLDKEIPGIMEFIRIRYGMENPNALLSRGIAGLAGKA